MSSIQKINGAASDTITKVNGTNDALLSYMLAPSGTNNTQNHPYFNSHSIDFNGTSNYMTCDTVADNMNANSGALSLWCKLDNDNGGLNYLVHATSDEDPANNRILIYWNHSNSKIIYQLKYNASSSQYAWASTGIEGDGNWHHVAMIWSVDGEGTAALTAYFDGSPAATVETPDSAFQGAMQKLYISRNVSAANGYWDGHIDEVAVWAIGEGHDVLNDDAIDQINNSGKGYDLRKNVNNYSMSVSLVGYWKMEENTGTSVVDSSGNSNTGTLSHSSLFSNDTI